MAYELVEVDGRALSAPPETGLTGNLQAAKMREDMQALLRGQQQMMSVLIAQQTQIEKLNAALMTVRISRTQESAIQSAIRARARAMCVICGLPKASERKVASAIRATLRETTGARAVGDLASCQFERAMDMISGWNMQGVMRKIRREFEREHE